jgi:hypothetical protein
MAASRSKLAKFTAQIHVDDFSDDQLLSTTINTNDPLSLEGIVDTPPPNNGDLWFEMTYDADQNVKCVYGHLHKKGIILRDAQYNRYPVGHKCGFDLFGLDWNLLQNHIKRISDRKADLLYLRSIANALGEADHWLRKVPDHPSISALRILRETFASEAKSLFDECASIARNDGFMYAEVDERDFQAEERRRERDSERNAALRTMTPAQRQREFKINGVPGSDKTPLFKKISRNFGSLPGVPIFDDREPLKDRIEAFLEQFCSLRTICNEPTSSISLEGITRVAIRAIREFAEALEEIDAALNFFTYSNLTKFSDWANKRVSGRQFIVDGAALRVENEFEESSVRIAAPKELTPIEAPEVAKLLSSLLRISK